MRLKKTFWHLKLELLGFFVIGVGLVFLYLSPVGQKTIHFFQDAWHLSSQKAHWQLKQVIIEGHRRSDKSALMERLNVKQGQAMNTISLSQMRQNLLTLPWVKEAIIERHLPDTLVVHITEKTPIALWQNNQIYFPLDESGHPIKDDKLLPSDLILVVGSDAPEHVLDLLSDLEQTPKINALARSAVRIEKRRWNLYLLDAENGLEILLPEKDVLNALKRLEYQNEKEGLLKKDLQAIDVRLSDRIILHPKKSIVRKKGKKK